MASKCSEKCWGLSLRPQHFSELMDLADLPYLEILGDNLLGHEGGPALAYTDALAARTQILMHTVGLNVGGYAPLDFSYLKKLKALQQRYQPLVLSDHLCFTRGFEHHSYDLLPLARTMDCVQAVSDKVSSVQDFLGQRLSLENISAYLAYRCDQMSEAEFFSRIVEKTGCGILLDINNLYINSVNFSFDPYLELAKFPLNAVDQVHMAGHRVEDGFLFDTHDQPVCPAVVDLAKHALPLIRPEVPIVLEWDGDEISLLDLCREFERMKKLIGDGDALFQSGISDRICEPYPNSF